MCVFVCVCVHISAVYIRICTQVSKYICDMLRLMLAFFHIFQAAKIIRNCSANDSSAALLLASEPGLVEGVFIY